MRAASRGHLEIEALTARRVVAHLERACKYIAALRAAHPEARVTRDLNLIVAQLHARVLAPLYRLYPDLKAARATDELPATPKPDPKHPVRLMGPATAVHLRWALNEATKPMRGPVLGHLCEHAKDEACIDPISDLLAELNAAAGPAYSSYPSLFVEEMRSPYRNRDPRTAETDANFRKNAPPPGAVTVSSAAMAVVRHFVDGLRHDIGPGCRIVSFLWYLKERHKGPDDKDWKETGPGLGLGSYDCDQVPSDVIRRVNGVPMIFAGDAPDRFVNKLIDQENGKFVLKDRGGPP